MATLIVQETTHWHDVQLVILDAQVTTLTYISDCDNLHYADAIGDIRQETLTVPETVFDHTISGSIAFTQEHTLVVAEAYNAHAIDSCDPSKNNSMWTSSVDYPKLPVLKLTARGENLIYGKSGGSRLPSLQLSIRAGARCGDGTLPDLGLTATATYDRLMSLSRKLPTMSLSARAGMRGGVMKLPVPELTMAVTGDLVGRLSKNLPGLTIDAVGSTPYLMRLSKRLPTLRLTVAMSGTNVGTLSAKLPPFKLTGAMSMNAYGTLDADLPCIKVSSITGHRSSIDVAGVLPTLVVSGIGTGGVDSGYADGYEEDRFDDYVLRYAR